MLTFMLGMSVALNISLVCAVLYFRHRLSVLQGEKEQRSAYEEILSMDLDGLEENTKDRCCPECPPTNGSAHNMLVAAAGKRDKGLRR
jgi:hypothetical protein